MLLTAWFWFVFLIGLAGYSLTDLLGYCAQALPAA